MHPADELGERTVRKVGRRLLPFLFLLYVVAFLDRVNFGYAALDMNSALGLSAEVFGFLSGIFFIGYLLFEVPSNMILQRIGARIWISRIIISWGIVVIVTAAATDAFQLAAFRFILGVAEAGFFPGIILYITCWFRKKYLASAVALFMAALAVSNIIGAPVSTWILDNVQWFGIAGWRWLFILEGLPALVLGVVTWFWLTDRPEDATWLEPEERDWLAGTIARENEEAAGTHQDFWSVMKDRRIWHLACIYCTVVIGLYGLGFWMPQIIRSMSPSFTNFEIGLVMVIPYLVALCTMVAWGAHSDRTGERIWHAAIPPIVGGIALAGAGLVPVPLLAFVLIIVATAGIYSEFGPFWTLPAVFLAEAAAAIGIAVINSIGNLGGFIGPSMVGYLTKVTGTTDAGLVAAGACLVLCGLLTLAVRPEGRK
ncbi:MAG: MFS transporter [Methanoregula sp.]|jgi:ACS family tartrate transporter-like MFS transporter|uniref:MFS transporter n=1 Tax=Methanoregula sp. TaxID=2052170 RepID=UPI002600E4A9|nr:MFS transporter [Methanoregula sp.]MCK9630713.1 MFS transporter [Methanoregula sp.]